MPIKLLILGGTMEAAQLAKRLYAELREIEIITSLAGRMVTLPDLPGRVRVGGFGGADGLADYLMAEKICAVIDATHPFARNISAHAVEACGKSGVPLLTLLRPAWPKQEGDAWIPVPDMATAARRLPELGRRPFITIGRMELDAFRPLSDLQALVRLIEPPPTPLPQAWRLVLGRPPFSAKDEERLMQDHGADVLLTKASGGQATYGKIIAARKLGLPVLMVERPAASIGEQAETLDEALVWLNDL